MTTDLHKVLYTARATAHGGRDGRTASDDGKLDLTMAPPKEMGGSGEGTNPEQLFAAGYASCFHSALMGVARRANESVENSAVTGEVGIGTIGGGEGGARYGIEVRLVVELPGKDRAVAEKLVAQAHEVCPYSNATRGNIKVTLDIIT
jgi:lipoyl-dependent peroxiredoxin